jgi:predicted nucleic acid-binding protein
VIVIDASAAVDLLVERGPRGAWVAATTQGEELFHAPHLIDVEVASALRRRSLGGELPASRGREALEALLDLKLVRYPLAPLLARVWALRQYLTAYDAAYVSLAEALGLPLVTTDARLGRARGHRAEIVAYAG